MVEFISDSEGKSIKVIFHGRHIGIIYDGKFWANMRIEGLGLGKAHLREIADEIGRVGDTHR